MDTDARASVRQPTVYELTRQKVYNINPSDMKKLTDTLLDTISTKISFTDFYHDKAFHCLL